jgi:Protein of unknown function (DUF2752)
VARERRWRFGHGEVFAVLFALSFAVARFLPVLSLGQTCPFRALTGLPCATCGMTRAFVRLAHGDVAGAAGASPYGALLAALAWLFAVLAVLRAVAGAPWPAVPPARTRGLAVLAVGALLANWAFLVVANRP